MSFADYTENYLLSYLFSSKTIYCAYGSGHSESSFTELSGSGYARVAFGAYTVTSLPGDNQYVSNDSAITWPMATGSQGTCSHIGIYDALTGGNFLGSVSLASLGQSNINVISGTQVGVAAGDFKVKLD